MTLNEESIKTHLPYYLTQDEKQGLAKELKCFPENINYYTNCYPDDMLQGGWRSYL